MVEEVKDPQKQVTDVVLLNVLQKQAVDSRFVEFFQDYAPRTLGEEHSPYAKFYRDLKSNKRFMVVSGLPMVNADGVKVEIGWQFDGSIYTAKPNHFSAMVEGTRITVTAFNDQPTGIKAGDWVTRQPRVFLGGVEAKPISEIAILLPVDPINPNYRQNILEWDYGICRRRLRIIEGRIRDRFIFLANPQGDVGIELNRSGKIPGRKGYAQYAISNQLKLLVNTVDSRTIPASEWNACTYPVEVR